jgi:hypothetical protein
MDADEFRVGSARGEQQYRSAVEPGMSDARVGVGRAGSERGSARRRCRA